ncbi:hypothetical protein WN944_021214 [Citrus x changshan-huyou]|uniref:Uncharacterized protein n=1 Tax=Citrus x changshan-huyou TaxID=2935761 RepID=A0AAP0MWF3_9ROSI
MASSHSVMGDVYKHVCRLGYKGHDDLTSSSSSFDLSPAICSGFQTRRWQLSTRVAL